MPPIPFPWPEALAAFCSIVGVIFLSHWMYGQPAGKKVFKRTEHQAKREAVGERDEWENKSV